VTASLPKGVYQRRSDGLYVAPVEAGRASGTRNRKTFTSIDPLVADAKRATYLAAAARSAAVKRGRTPTVAEAAAHYLEAIFANPDYEAGSWEYDRSKLHQYILPDLGHIRVDQLTWQDAQKVFNAMGRPGFHGRSRALSGQTRDHAREVARGLLTHCRKEGWVHGNIIEFTKKPKVTPRELLVLSPTQTNVVLDRVRDQMEYWHALFELAFRTGMREGELLGMPSCAIDWDRNQIRVRQALKPLRGPYGSGQTLRGPKWGSDRNVPIGPKLCVTLRRHAVLLAQARRAASDRWNDTGLLFPSPELGLPMVQSTFYSQIFMAAMTSAGIRYTVGGAPGFRFQDSRHCAATHMLLAKVPERVIRAILGHKNHRMLDRYTHIVDEMLTEAALAVESLGIPRNAREQDVEPKD
jgi:integrase